MTDSVVMPWLSDLTLKQQTVVLSALRGCDGKPKEDPSKKLTRVLRSLVLRNASPGDGKFMEANAEFLDLVKEVVEDIDQYPVHWVMHFIHAAEIVGYKYQAEITRGSWFQAYKMFVDSLHLRIESEQDLDTRLADGPVSPIKKYEGPQIVSKGYR